MRLLPREEKFFALFVDQAAIISEAARLLLEGVKTGNEHLAGAAESIRHLEHRGDEIIHDIITRLHQTFITPIDPEDIHSLSTKLDDVLDGIEDAAHRIVAYRLNPIPEAMKLLAEMIYACSMALQKAIQGLEKGYTMSDHLIEINRLENEADKLVRAAVTDLFDNEKDCVRLIKLKEIYEFLEATTDRCEDVADVLQNVVVKNS